MTITTTRGMEMKFSPLVMQEAIEFYLKEVLLKKEVKVLSINPNIVAGTKITSEYSIQLEFPEGSPHDTLKE